MARAKKKEKSQTDILWDEYCASALGEQERAAAYAESAEAAARARENGVYERAMEIVGTVKWSIPWQLLRMQLL